MRIAELVATVRDAAAVRRVYGEPYVADGVVVVPAAAFAGLAGGGAGDDPKGQSGEGGGVGLAGRPVGAFVIRGSEVRWVPAVDLTRLAAVVGTVAVAYLLTRRPRGMRS